MVDLVWFCLWFASGLGRFGSFVWGFLGFVVWDVLLLWGGCIWFWLVCFVVLGFCDFVGGGLSASNVLMGCIIYFYLC